MKLVLCPDLHITDKKPKNRTDEDYLSTCLGKLEFITHYHKGDIILQPGDFFDRPVVDYGIAKSVYYQIQQDRPVYSVVGQHDIKHHNVKTIDKSTLGFFYATQIITHLGWHKDELIQDNDQMIKLSGLSWFDDFDVLKEIDEKYFNVLVMHKTSFISQPDWPDAKDYVIAEEFMEEFPFDLVLAGDNHHRFVYETEGRYFVNLGCMMRKSIDLKDQNPVIGVFDTKKRDLELVSIPCRPGNEIFYEEDMPIEIAETKIGTALADRLMEGTKIDREEISKLLMSEASESSNKEVKKIMEEILSELEDKHA